jgi:hypothetical protein
MCQNVHLGCSNNLNVTISNATSHCIDVHWREKGAISILHLLVQWVQPTVRPQHHFSARCPNSSSFYLAQRPSKLHRLVLACAIKLENGTFSDHDEAKPGFIKVFAQANASGVVKIRLAQILVRRCGLYRYDRKSKHWLYHCTD